MKRKYKKSSVSPKEYVKIHNSSSSWGEVAKRTGLSETSCKSRATSYTEYKGIFLRRFGNGKKRVDWDKVRKAALQAVGNG